MRAVKDMHRSRIKKTCYSVNFDSTNYGNCLVTEDIWFTRFCPSIRGLLALIWNQSKKWAEKVVVYDSQIYMHHNQISSQGSCSFGILISRFKASSTATYYDLLSASWLPWKEDQLLKLLMKLSSKKQRAGSMIAESSAVGRRWKAKCHLGLPPLKRTLTSQFPSPLVAHIS